MFQASVLGFSSPWQAAYRRFLFYARFYTSLSFFLSVTIRLTNAREKLIITVSPYWKSGQR
ncbi:hypothetical protein SBA2_450033 [Acidobacteriia bacterium SbA2]|nr:hypothetical protein SBA2_450033 [Acidobacteriia bacterium SbA2]